MLSARSGSCLDASVAAMATYGEGLHLLGFLYHLPQKHCLALLSITLSIDAVDSALMRRVAPAQSAFSMDYRQLSLRRSFKGRPHPELDNHEYDCVWTVLVKGTVPSTAVLR